MRDLLPLIIQNRIIQKYLLIIIFSMPIALIFSLDWSQQARQIEIPIFDIKISKFVSSQNALSPTDASCEAAPASNFLFLPYDTGTGGDWLDTMTAAFDHHFPDYTCSLGLDSNCINRGMKIVLWDGEVASPVLTKTISGEEIANCYAPGSTIGPLNPGSCGAISGYLGATGESAIFYDGHDGYDWAISGTDAPILAGASGKFVRAWYDGSYGWTAEIDHLNGYVTRYSHLVSGSHTKEPGECVEAGEQIGTQGSTGKSTGNHLHFRVLKNGKVTDPFGWCYTCTTPPPDPLISYEGEASQNLWFGNTPRSIGQAPTRSSIGIIWDAFNTQYIGGPGIMLPVSHLWSSDSATFIADITIPDNSTVNPGEALIKTWRMRNSGTSTWGSGYQLVFRSGDQMGAPQAVDVPSTPPGNTVDLSVDIKSPTAPGKYYGQWQLRNPSGTYFGDPVWVQLIVPGNGSDEPIDPSPTGDIEIDDASYPSVVEPGQSFRPEIVVKVNSGSLLHSRGDLLRHKSGERYGAFPHVAVEGSVGAGQTYTFQFYADNPMVAPNEPGTYTSIWQVWRDGRWVGPEIEIKFSTQKPEDLNKPPNPPTLVDPGDWAVFDGTTPTLRVEHNGDPDGDEIVEYFFDIFESHDVPKSGWTTSNSWTPPGLGFWGYQWRAKVKDSRGAESDWSEVHRFNIENPDPQIYDFHWRWCEGSWGASDQVCFCADTNASALKVQVNRATDGSGNGEWQILNELGVGDYECDDDGDRPPTWTQLEYEAGAHLVRLYARKSGTWEAAATSELVINLPADRRPNKPFSQVPKRDSYINSTTVLFDWPETLRTNSYRLVASTNSDFSSPLIDQTFSSGTTEYEHTFASPHETIYWQVTSTGPYGTNESSSFFHIDVEAPSSVVQALPATSFDTKVTVSWSGSDDRSEIRWYDVQVRDGLAGTWEDWLLNTRDRTAIFAGQTGHTYYFRVRAMDKIGNYESYPTGDGDTSTLIDPTATPVTPWWNDDYSFKRNLVILNNHWLLTPVDYTVHLHFDASTTPTAQEIYDASQSSTKGDDVRVIYENSTELNRFIESFTPDAIDIWFPVQADIGVNASDENNYQLYYGNAAVSDPPTDLNTVFFPKPDGNTMGLWHFQEGSGSTVTDASGRGHNGSFAGAGWTSGRFGRAGLFNGSSSEVNFGNHNDFNLSAMTLEAWILLDGSTSTYPHVFNKENYWLRITNDRKPHAKIFGGEVSFNCPALDLNKWYHVAVTFNGSNDFRIYVNGEQCAQKTENHTPNNSNAPFKLGGVTNWPGTNPFPGQMQHVRVSNIARTEFPLSRKEIDPTVAAGSVILPPGAAGTTSDLVLQSLTTYPVDGVTFESGVIIQALVKNEGDASTTNGFYTHFYVDHLPGGPNDFFQTIDFLVNDPIAAGESITLTTVINDLGSLGSLSQVSLLSAMEEISTTLFSQVDSTGVVSEPDDSNNISTFGTEICIAAPDANESSDLTSAPILLTPGDFQTRNFHALADEDWLQVQASGGVAYILETSNLGLSADTYLYLYDTDSTTLLASNDDYDDTLASRIDWTAPADGIYYLLVKHWNPNVGGCRTIYTVSFYETGTGPPTINSTLYLPIILKGSGGSVATPTPVPTIAPTPTSEPGAEINAAFNGLPVKGKSPLTVIFNDQSTGETTSWQWDFGDGNTSTQQHPQHTYTTLGTFSVSLTVSGSGESDTKTKNGYIVVSETGPTAAFDATPLNGDTPLTVSFTDQSIGQVTEWIWDFGDGGTSTAQNPQHTYTNPGVYNVILTVSGSEGGATEIKSSYVIVTGQSDPTADFQADTTSGHMPFTVNFNDQSSGQIDSWQWNFGDGNSSTDQNPQHTYNEAGTYDVTLTVSGPNGTDTEVKSGYISVTAPAIFGDGRDGPLTISTDTNDIPIDSVATGLAGTNILNATNPDFSAGQKILIIQMQNTKAGFYEINEIASYAEGTITTVDPLDYDYSSGVSKGQVLVLKQYTDVTVESGKRWNVKGWNGNTGGILAFLADGTVTIDGTINGSSTRIEADDTPGGPPIGFHGGGTKYSSSCPGNFGQYGESYISSATCAINNSPHGGGGGTSESVEPPSLRGGGGGGGYGTPGEDGETRNKPAGLGGESYGNADMSRIFLGSGGGAGGDWSGNASKGGAGGGAVIIFSANIVVNNTGTIQVNGADGQQEPAGSIVGGGGGGSGGTVFIKAQTATLGTNLVEALGGDGFVPDSPNGASGGNGGVGRIRVEYIDSLTGTTNPAASTVQFTP